MASNENVRRLGMGALSVYCWVVIQVRGSCIQTLGLFPRPILSHMPIVSRVHKALVELKFRATATSDSLLSTTQFED
jgi:hypothetical protein